MKIKIVSLLAVPFGFSALLCSGAKGDELKPSLHTGRVIFQDDFSSGSLAPPWSVAKGDWQIKDRMVVGKEKAEDHHNAVLSLGLTNRDSAIQVSFRLEGASFFHLSYNHAGGHLFRVIVLPEGISISKDKDLKDPQSKGGVLAKSDAKFESGKWYMLLVEVQRGKVTVQTDSGVKLTADDVSLDRDKVNYRFVTKGASLDLSDVKIWRVAP